MRQFIDVHANAAPDRPAVIIAETGETLSYGALNRRSNQIAHVLRRRGLRRGDHVALLIGNSTAFFEVVWACQRAGLYYTPINTRLTAGEADYIVRDCGAHALIASSRFNETAGALAIDGALRLRASVHGAIPGFDPLDGLAESEPALPLADESEGASMIYSSGTTGKPKGVKRALPERALGDPDVFSAMLAKVYGWDARSIYLCPAPTYHGAGLWYSTAMHRIGATCVVMEKFTPEGFLDAVERYRVTHTQVVPTMMARLVKLPAVERTRRDLSSLKVLIHAAAPCPIPIKERMIDWMGPIVYEYFAATEGNGYTFIDAREWLKHKGSVGKPIIGELHIVSEDGRECAAGESGLVYFGGVTPFSYHNDPSKTDESRHPQGWTTTGDIGRLDKDGYLYLTDRKAFTIISGGVNIYPQEIENALLEHADVADAAVFGVPDDDFGEQVKAVVELSSSAHASDALAQELISHCRARLAAYKCPKSLDFVATLPRGENGKLYKKALRDSYWPKSA
ncbi:MAG: acyl-CoA synthetase [Hyphomonadaceae bacterium]